jgi:hypothetical protein
MVPPLLFVLLRVPRLITRGAGLGGTLRGFAWKILQVLVARSTRKKPQQSASEYPAKPVGYPVAK